MARHRERSKNGTTKRKEWGPTYARQLESWIICDLIMCIILHSSFETEYWVRETPLQEKEGGKAGFTSDKKELSPARWWYVRTLSSDRRPTWIPAAFPFAWFNFWRNLSAISFHEFLVMFSGICRLAVLGDVFCFLGSGCRLRSAKKLRSSSCTFDDEPTRS